MRQDDSADKADSSMASLQGQLLVASPNIGDERFEKTVILMCHHDPESAMGLVINRPASSRAPRIARARARHAALVRE